MFVTPMHVKSRRTQRFPVDTKCSQHAKSVRRILRLGALADLTVVFSFVPLYLSDGVQPSDVLELTDE